MARIRIENLPVIEDLTEAEAKAVKAGGVFGATMPRPPSFSVSITAPNPFVPRSLANFTGLSGNLRSESSETAVAGVRG